MRDQPDGAALLVTAQKVLREKLLPQLPAHLKNEALMVANAMAIATRQLQAGPGPIQDELEDLIKLLAAQAGAISVDEAGRLKQLNVELCASIRAGASDPGRPDHEATYQHLCRVARQRVQESNPKYLSASSAAALNQP